MYMSWKYYTKKIRCNVKLEQLRPPDDFRHSLQLKGFYCIAVGCTTLSRCQNSYTRLSIGNVFVECYPSCVSFKYWLVEERRSKWRVRYSLLACHKKIIHHTHQLGIKPQGPCDQIKENREYCNNAKNDARDETASSQLHSKELFVPSATAAW